MICPYCNKNDATVTLSRNVGDRPFYINICSECYTDIQDRFDKLADTLSSMNNIFSMSKQFGSQNLGKLQDIPAFPEQAFDVSSMPNYVQAASKINERIGYFRKIVIQPNCVFLPNKLKKTCSCCGINLQNFLLQFDRGCAICFLEFKDEIVEFAATLAYRKEDVDREENASLKIKDDIEKRIEDLENKKQQAIANKNWSLAAVYRDKLKSAKQEYSEDIEAGEDE